jgi:hypothetical protein
MVPPTTRPLEWAQTQGSSPAAPYSFGSAATVAKQGRRFACTLAPIVPTLDANIAMSMYRTSNVPTPPPLTTYHWWPFLRHYEGTGVHFQLLWGSVFGIIWNQHGTLQGATGSDFVA